MYIKVLDTFDVLEMCIGKYRRLCNDVHCSPCFEKSFASHEKSKYLLTNPRTVFKYSNKEFDFMCDCGHAFSSRLNHISKGNWCPYCSHQKLCEYPDCEQCFENSFASHPRSKCILDVDPRTVFRSSHCEYEFTCECGHIFSAALSTITSEHWCPYCSNKKLCNESDCKQCYNNSFASHPKSEFIVSVDPRAVFMNTHEEHDFMCDCGHAFLTAAANVANGRWCPYCSNKKLCNESDCKQCYENSFASHEKSKYLVDVDARTVFRFSNKTFDFKCERGHTFSSQLNNISGNGSWCPHCKHKTEDILCTFLEEQYSNVQRQFSADWCKRKRFDVVIHDIHVIIELDGPQHIDRQISNWASPEDNRSNDMYKMKCANENGYSVVRILQEDVLGDAYDWKTELANVIHEYSNPTNVFLCKNDEYNGHFTPST